MRDLETHSTGIGDHPALVIVDMCKGFLDPESPIGFECSELIYSNIKLVQKFRERNYPIIFTTTVYRNESDASVFRKKLPGLNILQPDSTEVSFLEELSPSTVYLIDQLGPTYKQLQTGVREKEKEETKGESVIKSRR